MRPGAARFALGLFFLASGTLIGFQEATSGPMKTYDERLIEVEKKVPGFGGMFLGEDGRLAVYLLDPSRITEAQAAIVSVFGASYIPAAGVRALQGRYAVSELKRWAERANALLEIRGVTIVDLDESRNLVAIGLEDASKRAAVEQRLKALGIPREAVAVESADAIRQLGNSPSKDPKADRGQ